MYQYCELIEVTERDSRDDTQGRERSEEIKPKERKTFRDAATTMRCAASAPFPSLRRYDGGGHVSEWKLDPISVSGSILACEQNVRLRKRIFMDDVVIVEMRSRKNRGLEARQKIS